MELSLGDNEIDEATKHVVQTAKKNTALVIDF